MTRHITRSPPRKHTRITMPLTGSMGHLEAHLSFEAWFALAFCTARMRRVSPLKVPAAALIRSALLHYAIHLDTADAAAEFAKVTRASAAPVVDEDAQVLAHLRLAAVPLDEALPSFHVIRMGPAAIKAAEDFADRADALADEMLANRRPRRKVAP